MSELISIHQLEQLSSYLDGELTVEHKNRLDSELKSNPDLARALAALQQTRSLLRSLPQKPVRRNFTLTPEMITPKPRAPFVLFPFFSTVSAVATILFLITLFFAPPAATQTGVALQTPAQKEALSAPASSPEKEAPTPFIITWGFGAYGKGGGGGQFGAEMAEPPVIAPAIPLLPVEATPQPKIQETQPPPQAPLEGAGPILGIQKTTPLPAATARSVEDGNAAPQGQKPAGRSGLLGALAGTAVASALAAYLFWQRSRA